MKLTLNLSPDDLAQVSKQAERLGITQEKLVVQIITQNLAKIQEKANQVDATSSDGE